jgi:nitric oxide reductase subunit C
MGCHTLMGEGAYYAPELTRVYRARGPAFIRAMLRDPAAMYPGQRQMQNYHFTDDARSTT